MNRKDAADLDRHITGNYGEDSVDAQTQGYIDAMARFATEYTLDLKHGKIGPQHDPYGTTEVKVTRKADGHRGKWYEDGLGRRWIELFDAGSNAAIQRYEWHDDSTPWYAEAALVHFEQWIGISPGTAREAAEHALANQDEDPMGPASRYE